MAPSYDGMTKLQLYLLSVILWHHLLLTKA